MPEGLNPIETGKKLHEHGEAAEHQRAEESDGHGKSEGRHSRIVQIGEAALLALVTLTAAWAGYSAAKWGTASRIDIAESSTLRNLATRDDLTAISLRNFDSSTFNAWYIAFTLNSPQKEAIAVRRFRPEFRVAFNAWMATDPCTTRMPTRSHLYAAIQAGSPGASRQARQRGQREVPGRQQCRSRR